MGEIEVTQVRSAIGSKPKHRGTLRALGLGRIGKSNVLPDRPEIRGMIAKVPHLIETREVTPEARKAKTPATKTPAAKTPATTRSRSVPTAAKAALGKGAPS